MEINKILILTYVILLSGFTYASNSSPSPSATLENENYYSLETFTDFVEDTMKQFHYAYLNFTSRNIPFYRNGDAIDVSFELRDTKRSVSFSDFQLFSTANENFLCVSDVLGAPTLGEFSSLKLEANPFPNKTCRLTGRINLTDFTRTTRTTRKLKGTPNVLFEATFDFPRIKIISRKPSKSGPPPLTNDFSFENTNIKIKIHGIEEDSHVSSFVRKSLGEIETNLLESIRKKINEEFIKFIRTDPSARVFYNLHTNREEQISLNNRTFASFEKSYYYLITNGSKLTSKNRSVHIDSVRVNGLQPTLMSVHSTGKETYFTWDISHYSPHLSGYVNCRYHGKGKDSGTFEKLKFKDGWFLMDARADENVFYIHTMSIEMAKLAFSDDDTDLPSTALQMIEVEVPSLIAKTIESACVRRNNMEPDFLPFPNMNFKPDEPPFPFNNFKSDFLPFPWPFP